MKIVKLYGHLGKEFGRVHKFDVRTPAEAISALCANFSGFKQHVLNHSEPGYRVLVNKEDRSALEELGLPADGSISFIPVTAGSGGNFGRIVLGAVLIWAAPYLGSYILIGSSTAAAATVATAVTYAATAIGTSLVLSGVSGILFKPPKVRDRDAEKDPGSANFNGPINLSTQGNPVPLAYGKILVGSQVISANIITSKKIYPPTALTMTNPAAQNTYNQTYIRAIMAGYDDAAGRVTKFKITALPSTGTLYLNEQLTSPVVLNQDILGAIVYGTKHSALQLIWNSFSSRIYGAGVDLTGNYVRELYYKPPTGVSKGTASFTYIAIDNDGAESKPASATVKWETIADNSTVQEWQGN
jgi:predicted phage tail protein